MITRMVVAFTCLASWASVIVHPSPLKVIAAVAFTVAWCALILRDGERQVEDIKDQAIGPDEEKS